MRISKNIRTSYNQDGAVLMDIHGGSMLTINPVGAIIWRQLNDGLAPVRIAENLATAFHIPQEQAISDVDEFVQQLESQQLIRPTDSGHEPLGVGSGPWRFVCDLFGWRRSQMAQAGKNEKL